jgi:DNA end-binding protein Ku
MPLTGEPVHDQDIVRGYEIGEGRYIEITEEELEAVAIESAHTIDIDLFVPKKEIDELYWNTPYYVAPDGEVGRQAFAVIREAIGNENVVALGRVVFTTREDVIAIEPRGKGLLGITLRLDERGSVRQPTGRGGSGSHHHRGSAGRSSARAQG